MAAKAAAAEASVAAVVISVHLKLKSKGKHTLCRRATTLIFRWTFLSRLKNKHYIAFNV